MVEQHRQVFELAYCDRAYWSTSVPPGMNRQVVAFDHNRLLKTLAAEMFEPLGLYQIGRSRTWVDDHAWWAIIVSFGPSGFGRGTYLDVGVTLLWRWMGALVFDTDLKNKWKTPMSRVRNAVRRSPAS